MIHNEHFRKADELYEIVHDMHGNALHVYIKDGQAIVFAQLIDFIDYMFMGKNDVPRMYMDEDDLMTLYESDWLTGARVNILTSKTPFNFNPNALRKQVDMEFYDSVIGCDVKLTIHIESADFWTSVGDYDIHYCEDYKEVCVYRVGEVDKSIYSQKIK